MTIDISKDLIVRWDDGDAAHPAVLKQAGIWGVISAAADPKFAEACNAAGIVMVPSSDLTFVRVSEVDRAAGRNVVLTQGLWPGVTRPPSVAGRGDEAASASREPWVDANSYWVAWLRALYPQRPAVLGYLPELGDRGVPYDTLELALVEARVPGGNYILSVEPNYRAALLQKDPKAVAAWKQLGQTARWLDEHADWFRQPCPSTITALADSGDDTAELVNLLFRRNASPLVCSASATPPPDPQRRLALVAANMRRPSPELAAKILAHAQAGTAVITATPPDQQWWRTPELKALRSEEDREFFTLGRGQVVAYRQPIMDPSEFALDVIDIVTHKRRPVRLWNAQSVISLVTASARAGERLLHLMNYGKPVTSELQARVQGDYTRAVLHRPDGSPVTLKPAKRGTTTEVFVPELKRLGVIVFS